MPETTNYKKHQNQNPLQKALIDNFYTELFKMVKPLRAKTILDVGCGEGFTLQKLKEKGIGLKNEGIDYSHDAVEMGNKIYPELKIKQGDVYKLDYKNESFELVICTEVLEHLDNPKKAIDEIRRVSSKYIVFSVQYLFVASITCS